MYIKDLNISNNSKNFLEKCQIIKTSELNNHNYMTLIKLTDTPHETLSVVYEMNKLGYLLSPENEISIYDISLSTRTIHVLERNYIIYLSQLNDFTKEELLCFRNLGKKSIDELTRICKLYSIEL